ncbi:invasion protein regulator [Cedecea lapagei]|uniref:Invasion protein regulator n=2 Tax=Cedecea lapagei TaxID=158823 RepID=A0A3S4KU89_9ENTR|nr:invasion protein regulator [Cedecea lapagei]
MVVFGRYQLFPDLGLLMRDGVRLEPGERAMAVLKLLVSEAGQVVAKETLLETVWPKEIVEENNLQAQISALRKIFGADRNLITTIFGRGYCFTAPVSKLQAATSSLPVTAASSLLPRPRSPLIGRERELGEIRKLLLEYAVCTLAGPAGIGKTRLLLEVAREAAGLYPDGVFFADLSSLNPGSDPVPVLRAAVAGIRGAGQQSTRPALLIIDNCEHLAAACAQEIERLLQANDLLNVLLTSQTPLGIEGEQVYRVGPLALPSAHVDVRQAQTCSAVEFLVQRIQSVDYQFRLTEENVQPVTALCRLLDAVPLALEIVAARAASLGPEAVLADLESREALPDSHSLSTSSRHRTLADALDWSYRLLKADEQRVFQALSIFPGEFELAAAKDLLKQEKISDVVASMVAKSLLVFQGGVRPARYRYLTIVRTYARTLLADDSEQLSLSHAHLTAENMVRAKEAWTEVSSPHWRRQYGYLIDDLRAAADWCFGAGQNASLGRSILANATPFWIQLSLHGECRQRITAAINNPQNGHATQHEEMLMQAALGSALGWAQGPVEENGQAWQRAGELAGKLNDREIQLQAEYGLWLYHLRSGRYMQAGENGKKMAELASEIGDYGALLTARRLVGTALHFSGDQQAALREIQALLDRAVDEDSQRAPFRFGLDQRVAGWAFLVRALWVTGDIARARRAEQLAVEEAKELDHACSLCAALAEGSCTLAALTGDIDRVLLIASQIETIAVEHGLGFWRLYASAFMFWGRLRRQPETILPQQIHAMLATLRANGFDPAYSLFLSDFSAALAQKGRREEADALISERLSGLDINQSLWNLPELMRVQAQIRYAGRPEDVLEFSAALQSALLLAKSQTAKGWAQRIEADLSAL